MRNFKLLGAMLVFLVSLESCKGCAVGADAGCPAGQVKVNGACAAPWDGKCPTGQINIDDGKTSAATSCKAVVVVADKNELAAEIQKATAGGNWTANLNYIDTSKVTDMKLLFADKAKTVGMGGYDLEKFNGRIDKWNTSNVTTMAWMFSGANSFDQPIGNWNVSNVTGMDNMFSFATAFNQDIGNWKTDNVTSMLRMFTFATKFNQPIGNWNVSKVTDMTIMFTGATAFDKDLSQWTPTAVTSVNMLNMFTQTAMETNNNFGKHAPWYCTTTGTKGTGGCPP